MANTSKGYNGNTDFLKWYKGMYGADYDKDTGLVRKEGMSDGDWDVGTILHNYYIKNQQNEADRQEKIDSINQRYDGMKDTAMAGFDSARQALGENKSVAQQNASITYDKLKKYLPMKQQAQGLGGLGTQSAELDAYNRYMSQMGGIASDYQENMRAIDTEETSSLGELERYRTDSLDEADTLYDNLSRANADSADDEAKAAWDGYLRADKQSKDEAYAMAQSILASSTSGDVNELLAYVNGLAGKVSPEQLTALQNYAKSVAEGNYKKATDEQTSKQQSDYNNAYNTARGVLQSAITENPEELLTYVNSLEGKVSAEQLAALRQIATNVAGTNLKANNEKDRANANEIVEITVSGLLDAGDIEAARKYLESNKGLMGQSTYEAYVKIVESYEQMAERERLDAEQKELDERILSGKEYVSYGGQLYRIEEKIDPQSNVIKDNSSLENQIKAAGYNGLYDDDIPNGTTFLIRASSSAQMYVTYYNGEWYRSQNKGITNTGSGSSGGNTDGSSGVGPTYKDSTILDKYPGIKEANGPLGNYLMNKAKSVIDGSSETGKKDNGVLAAYANTPQYDTPAAQVGAAIGEWLLKLFGKK